MLSIDSLFFVQSDFGMDVSGASHALVVATPAVRRTRRSSATARRKSLTAVVVTPGPLRNRTRAVRSLNDRKLMNWLRQSIIKLEAEVKAKQVTIDELHARPAPSTEREMYLLSEIELIGRQFESEYSTLCLFLSVTLSPALGLIMSFTRCGEPRLAGRKPAGGRTCCPGGERPFLWCAVLLV